MLKLGENLSQSKEYLPKIRTESGRHFRAGDLEKVTFGYINYGYGLKTCVKLSIFAVLTATLNSSIFHETIPYPPGHCC